jgi:hypothetical protein
MKTGRSLLCSLKLTTYPKPGKSPTHSVFLKFILILSSVYTRIFQEVFSNKNDTTTTTITLLMPCSVMTDYLPMAPISAAESKESQSIQAC